MSWRINADLAAVSLAGPAAILMEVLEPSVMAGVEEHSSYRTDPLSRAKNTLGYVFRTTFGSTEAATAVIERVKRIHGRVRGIRPDGVPYEALDPELIGWVRTCIPWAIMTAFDRFHTPLTDAEKDQYLREQAVVGRLGGADWVPETTAMSLMPDWARHLTNTWHPSWFQRLAGDTIMRTQSGLVRWAYPEPPCVQLARDRAGVSPADRHGSVVGTAARR